MARSYNIACIQSAIEVIDDPSQKDDVIARNLDRSLRIAESVIRKEDAKVIVFPEGWLQGHNHLRSEAALDWTYISSISAIGLSACDHEVSAVDCA